MITVEVTKDARFVVDSLRHQSSKEGDLMVLSLENRTTCHTCGRPDHWNRVMSVVFGFNAAKDLEYAIAQEREGMR